MNRSNRTQLALGLLLILVGAWFVASRQIPALQAWIDVQFAWPLNIIAAGGALLVIGLVVGAPGMAIPAAIVAGIGGILYYQSLTGQWDSWSYMWTLIPGFVGIGNILSGVLGGERGSLRSGANLLVVSAFLFLIFGALFGGLNLFGEYGPAVLLILLGVWVIARGLIRTPKS